MNMNKNTLTAGIIIIAALALFSLYSGGFVLNVTQGVLSPQVMSMLSMAGPEESTEFGGMSFDVYSEPKLGNSVVQGNNSNSSLFLTNLYTNIEGLVLVSEAQSDSLCQGDTASLKIVSKGYDFKLKDSFVIKSNIQLTSENQNTATRVEIGFTDNVNYVPVYYLEINKEKTAYKSGTDINITKQGTGYVAKDADGRLRSADTSTLNKNVAWNLYIMTQAQANCYSHQKAMINIKDLFGKSVESCVVGTNCVEKCQGTTKYKDPYCTTIRECQYLTIQENSVACGATNLCANITCADKCEGTTWKTLGKCDKGNCSFSEIKNSAKCSGTPIMAATTPTAPLKSTPVASEVKGLQTTDYVLFGTAIIAIITAIIITLIRKKPSNQVVVPTTTEEFGNMFRRRR